MAVEMPGRVKRAQSDRDDNRCHDTADLHQARASTRRFVSCLRGVSPVPVRALGDTGRGCGGQAGRISRCAEVGRQGRVLGRLHIPCHRRREPAGRGLGGAEFGQKVAGGGAVSGFGSKAALDQWPDFLRNPVEARRLVGHAVQHVSGRAGPEGALARSGEDEDRAQAEYVAGRPHFAGSDLLRGHESQRADQHAGAG